MILHDFFHNQLVQIAIVVVVVSPLQLVGSRIIERIVRRVITSERYETKLDEKKREDTIVTAFQALLVVLLWAIALLSILAILRVNLAALVTGAGIFGVIFGLGAQNIIKDYLAGIYILTENQYRVGDIVSLSGGVTGQPGVSGVVEEITLRITRLRGQDGTLSTVRNGDSSVVTNRTFQYAAVVIDLTLAFDTNIEQVETIINETGKAMMRSDDLNGLMTEPISFLRVDDFTDLGVTVKVIGKVKPAAQWEVAGEFRRRIADAFQQADIHFATPLATPATAHTRAKAKAVKK